MLKLIKQDENKNGGEENEMAVVNEQGGKAAPKKEANAIKPNVGVSYVDSRGKKEEGPELPMSPGRMSRSSYSKIAHVRLSSAVNLGGLSSRRLESPSSRVTTPSAGEPAKSVPNSGVGMFKERISSL